MNDLMNLLFQDALFQIFHEYRKSIGLRIEDHIGVNPSMDFPQDMMKQVDPKLVPTVIYGHGIQTRYNDSNRLDSTEAGSKRWVPSMTATELLLVWSSDKETRDHKNCPLHNTDGPARVQIKGLTKYHRNGVPSSADTMVPILTVDNFTIEWMQDNKQVRASGPCRLSIEDMRVFDLNHGDNEPEFIRPAFTTTNTTFMWKTESGVRITREILEQTVNEHGLHLDLLGWDSVFHDEAEEALFFLNLIL